MLIERERERERETVSKPIYIILGGSVRRLALRPLTGNVMHSLCIMPFHLQYPQFSSFVHYRILDCRTVSFQCNNFHIRVFCSRYVNLIYIHCIIVSLMMITIHFYFTSFRVFKADIKEVFKEEDLSTPHLFSKKKKSIQKSNHYQLLITDIYTYLFIFLTFKYYKM